MTIKKKALGRGLSALLENTETDITTTKTIKEGDKFVVGSTSHIPVEQIEANPFQPRTHFEEEALFELAESIRVQGIIQPVTVRKMGYDKYQLISGERRFRASQLVGLKTIPAYIRVANDQEMLEMALLENIQRENLDAIEVAISYKRLIEECNLTQEELSERMSKQRSTVTNYLRLLKLPAEIQLAIREGKISMGHARSLINIEDKDQQLALYNEIINNQLSVRQIEEIVRNFVANKKNPGSRKPYEPVSVPFEDQKIAKELNRVFDLDVEFKRQPNGKGKIVIPFKSEKELKRIMEVLELE